MKAYDKTIFLCGFMGCGKTTVGKALADNLGCVCKDLDELIVKTEGRTIPEIFAQSGEEYFRSVETRLIGELCGGGVVALGGGAVLKKENVDTARRGGVIVFIDTDFELCFSRICGDKNRPLAASADKQELFERYRSRLDAYNYAADIKISGDKAPDAIADDILSRL